MAGRKKPKPLDIAAPPPEQIGAFMVEPVHDRTPNGGLNLKGTAYRRRPMIDILFAAGLFTPSQHKALKHFRHHADMIDRSPVSDSLSLERGGSGDGGYSLAVVNAAYIAGACERAAGNLADILRAVVVDDVSLSQWAMDRYGAIEQRRVRGGKVSYALEPKRKGLEIAKLEIRMAAVRVEAELAA